MTTIADLSTLSPMMQQWKALKEQSNQALLLFRLGDFYEAFFDDAKTLSEAIDVVLTQRQTIPMSGIPYHQLDVYLEKLIEKQLIIAIAEQVETADGTKGLVKREITEIISPATYLNGKRSEPNYYFASIYQINTTYGLAFLELSTGEFITLEVDQLSSVTDELAKRKPVELLVSGKFEKKHPSYLIELKNLFSFRLTIPHESRFEPTLCQSVLTEHFGSQTLIGFGLDGHTSSITACGALLKYLKSDLCRNLQHLHAISFQSNAQYLKLDHSTLHHLDILEQSKGKISLQSALNRTVTPMGIRLFSFFLTHPLLDPVQIRNRQNGVAAFLNRQQYKLVQSTLRNIKDLKRIAKRIELGIIQPRELISLKLSFYALLELKQNLIKQNLADQFEKIDLIDYLAQALDQLERSLAEAPPTKIGQSPLFKMGYNQELDDLYQFKSTSENFLEDYQGSLREQLGIKTLKVGYSRAFGYYFEVSRGQSSAMPDSFHRLQTLVNAERFTSSELKDFEKKMLTCESSILHLEESLFYELKENLKDFCDAISTISDSIALIDVLCSFAQIADEYNFCRPEVNQSNSLIIESGKHPVLALNQLDSFISNDLRFDENLKMMLITGPNMAGKSTYIRQIALLVLLAQIGSYVPAKSMQTGYFDQIFSRIGASDDLNRGLSTFMVEMTETANILHHATPRSLIILDEIGRGTSTYDGIAIASAVAEFLVSKKNNSPKTLFATHYFELTKLEQKFQQIKNFHVSILEKGDEVVFLRKILPGILDKSFGIHVAKLAGIPSSIILRAEKLLKDLEQSEKTKRQQTPSDEQYLLFREPVDSKAIELKNQIINMDLDELSPKDALKQLYLWQDELKK